ncbi:MAG: trehalose-phosphatase [Ilumatobacteraceae bacterium]
MTDGPAFDRPSDVAGAIAGLARPLLVATDVDGTLSPIAPSPQAARLAPGALDALRAVAGRGGVDVAVVSGRSLAELRDQFGLDGVGHLVGSHGAESVHAALLDDDERALLDGAVAVLGAIVAATPGARLERKPMGAALHVRGATPSDAGEAIDAARAVLGTDPRIQVHEGHAVYEVAVRHVTKAGALAELRAEFQPAAVVFLGDDRSDETAFAALGPGDLGVKVGTGPTAARLRVATPADVVEVLRLLVAALG